MAWHRIENAAGEVQIVASLDGIDLDKWKAVPIAAKRPPTQFQRVNPDGTMTTDRKAVERARQRRPYASLSRNELLDLIAEMKARLDKLDLI